LQAIDILAFLSGAKVRTIFQTIFTNFAAKIAFFAEKYKYLQLFLLY
jgi:hypothetical protein